MGGTATGILARTARGVGWVLAWRLVTRMLGLASSLVLVRLLAPGDFGLVALAATLATAIDICLALGVEDQIVRARHPGRGLYDTAFTLNLLRAAVVAILVAAAAAPAARFFSDARLEAVLIALAISAAVSGIENIGTVDFRRDLDFDKEFRLLLLPRLAGMAVTLLAAITLHSHWALVAGILTGRTANLAMGYAMHPYRPRLTFAAWRDLAGVSFWTWAVGITSVARDRMDSLVIGRALGAAQVGIYAAGAEVATLPTSEMVDPICRAAMPGFAETVRTGTAGTAGETFLRILGLTALLTLPAGLGISLVAGPVVALAFGQAWVEAAPVVAVLGLASTLTLFGNVGGALLNAQARLRTLLGITLAGAGCRIVLLLGLTPQLGLFGAGLAVGLAILTEQLLLMFAALAALRLRPGALLAGIWRPALAAAAMALALWLAGLGWASVPTAAADAAQRLAAGIALGVTTYAGTLAVLWIACGRPAAAAEADMLVLLRRIADAIGGRHRNPAARHVPGARKLRPDWFARRGG